jgi:integration host factor subunit beta
MVKSELINTLAKQFPNLSYSVVETAVKVIIESMINELSNGGQVEIRNFGRFSVRKRKATMGRNPRNGQSVLIKERHIVHFNTAKELKARVNKLSKEYSIKKV